MFKRYTYILFIISILNLSCQNKTRVNQNDCYNIFNSIGLIDFELYQDKEFLLKKYPDLIKNNIDDKYEFYELNKNEIIIDTQKNIVYSLIFEDKKLISFSFKLEGSLNYFEYLRDYIMNNSNKNFINEKNKKKSEFRFLEINDNCRKYFKIKHKRKKLYIIGGLRTQH